MGLLDRFELVKVEPRKKSGIKIFIVLQEGKIEFSSKLVSELGFPPYVKIYIDEKGKRVAFQACEKMGRGSFPFVKKSKNGKTLRTVIARKAPTAKLRSMAGLKPGDGNFRFYGEKEEEFILIDLAKEEKTIPLYERNGNHK